MKNTKERLLQTATKLFAERGMDGVSTRDLVKLSGVNLCSINYYFGTKQNLYNAVLDSVVEDIKSFAVSKQFPLQTQSLSCEEEFEMFISYMLDFLVSDKISGAKASLLVKEMLQPSIAYNKLYIEVIEPMHRRLTTIIMKLTGLPEHQAIIQTHCLMGQIVMFKIHKVALLKRLGIKEYTPEVVESIKAQIIKNCRDLLQGKK